MTPILRGPNWKPPFHIHTDASDSTLGEVLGQKEGIVEHVIYYISNNLQGVELNYTIIEKELLAVVYALNKFWHYITSYEVFVYTDHTAIKYLMNKPSIFGRLARWILLMREFNVKIIDNPG